MHYYFSYIYLLCDHIGPPALTPDLGTMTSTMFGSKVHKYHNHALSLSFIVEKGKQNEIKMKKKQGHVGFLMPQGFPSNLDKFINF